MGDFNVEESEPWLSQFLFKINDKNIVKESTCYKSLINLSLNLLGWCPVGQSYLMRRRCLLSLGWPSLKCDPTAISGLCKYFWGPWVSFVTTDEFWERVSKSLQGLVSHELTAYFSVFNLFLTQWIMVILSEGCIRQITFNNTTF